MFAETVHEEYEGFARRSRLFAGSPVGDGQMAVVAGNELTSLLHEAEHDAFDRISTT
jgi:hypothetical protein